MKLPEPAADNANWSVSVRGIKEKPHRRASGASLEKATCVATQAYAGPAAAQV
jgi:hypothetical protein